MDNRIDLDLERLTQAFVDESDPNKRRKAFRDVIENAYDRFRKLAHFILRQGFPALGEAHDTASVADAAVLKMLEHFDRYEPRDGFDFLKFAAMTIRSVLLDLAKRRRTELQRRRPLGDFAADPDSARLHDWIDYLDEFEQLPPELREVVELNLLGYTLTEIGTILGIGQPSVSKRRDRAIHRLKAPPEPLNPSGAEGVP